MITASGFNTIKFGLRVLKGNLEIIIYRVRQANLLADSQMLIASSMR